MKHARTRGAGTDPTPAAPPASERFIRATICKQHHEVEEEPWRERQEDELLHDHNNDGVDRRGFLKCMAWAGTGALYVMQGGVLKSYASARAARAQAPGGRTELRPDQR